MNKNLFVVLFIIFFIIAQIGLWKTHDLVGRMIDETGYIKCIPEKTRPDLCEKFSFYRTFFLIGAVLTLVMLIFRKKIIKDH